MFPINWEFFFWNFVNLTVSSIFVFFLLLTVDFFLVLRNIVKDKNNISGQIHCEWECFCVFLQSLHLFFRINTILSVCQIDHRDRENCVGILSKLWCARWILAANFSVFKLPCFSSELLVKFYENALNVHNFEKNAAEMDFVEERIPNVWLLWGPHKIMIMKSITR